MKETEVEALLGRDLSSAETQNFKLYLDLATERIENLLCMSLALAGDDPDAEERIYSARPGYRTLYVDPFTAITTIVVDGDTVSADDYTLEDNRVVFEEPMGTSSVTITGTWGYSELPASIKLLLARMFELTSKPRRGGVRAKSIEDFSVTYADISAFEEFVADNRAIIEQYRLCDPDSIHGEVYDEFNIQSVWH